MQRRIVAALLNGWQLVLPPICHNCHHLCSSQMQWVASSDLNYLSPLPQKRCQIRVELKPNKVSHAKLHLPDSTPLLLPDSTSFLLPNSKPFRFSLEKLDELKLCKAVDIKLDLSHGQQLAGKDQQQLLLCLESY